MGIVIALSSVGLAACGGGERQDEDEPEGEFPVEIVSGEFAAKQRLAQTSDLTLQIRNSGDETIPDLAVTVFTDADSDEASTDDTVEVAPEDEDSTEESEDPEALTEDEDTTEEETEEDEDEPQPEAQGAFSVISQQPNLAIPSRPVWILEQGFPHLVGGPTGNPPPGEIAASGG